LSLYNNGFFHLAVLVSGGGTNLQAVLDAVESGEIKNAKVALVVSNRDGAYGLERAKNHGIQTAVISKKEPEKLIHAIKEHEIDGIILAGYLSILPPEVVEQYTDKIINIHPSLLPMFGGMGYYGLKVHTAVLSSGVSYTGATAHLVDNGVDTGKILVRARVPVEKSDTAEALQKRVLAIEHKVLVEAVKIMVSGHIEKTKKNPIELSDTYSDHNGQSNVGGGQVQPTDARLAGLAPAETKNVLIIGNGGREHAIGWKLRQNKNLKLYFAPGNGGTAELGENINISVEQIEKLADFAESYKMDLTIVGPELPLTLGVADEFKRRGLRIFGPGEAAAKLEGSKSFAKEFMQKHKIPTAEYTSVISVEDGVKIIRNKRFPLVLKADGLAAGKGVVVCNSISEATSVLNDMLNAGAFGDAGNKVVIEEFLEGKEVSLLCFTDSETIVPMETASDYKRALDKDLGANTGGMGSISPSPYYTPRLGDEIAEKTLEGLKAEGLDYQGVLYIGLILTLDGPKVLEYNARFGDPETQALLPRLETDLYEIAMAVTEKRLSSCKLKWNKSKAVAVVMASGGYPEKYETGHEIEIKQTKSMVFHAGTKLENKKLMTDGGRVLAVTAMGENFEAAQKAAYKDLENITFKGASFRRDIGQTGAQRDMLATRF